MVFELECLTNNQQILIGEFIRWYFKIERRRTFSDASRGVVMGAVARAKVAVVVALISKRHTTWKMNSLDDYIWIEKVVKTSWNAYLNGCKCLEEPTTQVAWHGYRRFAGLGACSRRRLAHWRSQPGCDVGWKAALIATSPWGSFPRGYRWAWPRSWPRRAHQRTALRWRQCRERSLSLHTPWQHQQRTSIYTSTFACRRPRLSPNRAGPTRDRFGTLWSPGFSHPCVPIELARSLYKINST